MIIAELKEKLYDIYPGVIPFDAGYALLPRNTNGQYLPYTRSIVINNRKGQFANGNLIMYTGVHELAHHVCMADKGDTSTRPHNKLFWGVFHNLLEGAEAAGYYRRNTDAEIEEAAGRARGVDRQIAALRRELGNMLIDIQGLCLDRGVRYEDVIERDIGLSRATWKAVVKESALSAFPEAADMGQDAQALAVKRDGPCLAEIMRGVLAKKSIVQIGMGPEPRAVDPLTALEIEKEEIDKRIKSLQGRLFLVTKRIFELEGDQSGEEAV
jgi:hypothetical protein